MTNLQKISVEQARAIASIRSQNNTPILDVGFCQASIIQGLLQLSSSPRKKEQDNNLRAAEYAHTLSKFNRQEKSALFHE